MYVRLAVGRVVPKHREAFMRRMHEDGLGANTMEPYGVEYHVSFGLPPNEDVAVIYQVYRDKRGYYAHIETPHSNNPVQSLRDLGGPAWELFDLTGRGGRGGVLECETFMPADDEWRSKGVRLF